MNDNKEKFKYSQLDHGPIDNRIFYERNWENNEKN